MKIVDQRFSKQCLESFPLMDVARCAVRFLLVSRLEDVSKRSSCQAWVINMEKSAIFHADKKNECYDHAPREGCSGLLIDLENSSRFYESEKYCRNMMRISKNRAFRAAWSLKPAI